MRRAKRMAIILTAITIVTTLVASPFTARAALPPNDICGVGFNMIPFVIDAPDLPITDEEVFICQKDPAGFYVCPEGYEQVDVPENEPVGDPSTFCRQLSPVGGSCPEGYNYFEFINRDTYETEFICQKDPAGILICPQGYEEVVANENSKFPIFCRLLPPDGGGGGSNGGGGDGGNDGGDGGGGSGGGGGGSGGGGGATPITQESVQESEAGEIGQNFVVS